MRLQAGPREDEPGCEREDDAAHQAQHPGRPKSLTPKVDYRGAAQTGVSHVVSRLGRQVLGPAGRYTGANSSLKPNSLLAGKIQGILFVWASESGYSSAI